MVNVLGKEPKIAVESGLKEKQMLQESKAMGPVKGECDAEPAALLPGCCGACCRRVYVFCTVFICFFCLFFALAPGHPDFITGVACPSEKYFFLGGSEADPPKSELCTQ